MISLEAAAVRCGPAGPKASHSEAWIHSLSRSSSLRAMISGRLLLVKALLRIHLDGKSASRALVSVRLS